MKRTTVFAMTIASGLVASAALAQPHDDHRDYHHRPVPPPPIAEHGRRDWKIEAPVVTSYSQMRGKVGERITIRGKNFPADAQIIWAGSPITGVTVAPTEIAFVVPTGAANGPIFLRGSGLQADLAIGNFEVADLDKAALDKVIKDREVAAKADWDAETKRWDKDKAKREASLAAQEEAMEKDRADRRAKYQAELAAKWNAAFLADGATVAELAEHAKRTAILARIQRLAAADGDSKIGVRVEVDIRREDERHDQRMAALKAAFKGA